VRGTKVYVAFAVIATFYRCIDSHQLIRSSTSHIPRLSEGDSIYIAVSRDGIYGSQRYPGSGVTTAQVLLSSFAKRARRVEIGSAYQTFDDALKSARNHGYQYLVYPTILHWEDRATEWSAIPDRVEVKIEIIEATTGSPLDSAIIKGKSGLMTFGGDHPQDLLPKPVEDYVSGLFGAP